MRTNILFLFAAILLFACRSNKANTDKPIATPATSNGIVFLDSIAASKAIIDDDVDGFFDDISIVDMAIQMKSEKDYSSRTEALAEYKDYLRRDVSDWTTAEKRLMDRVFDSIQVKVKALNPKLYPQGMKLVKIKTTHYGPDVYYTRGNCIMIPENIFKQYNAEKMVSSVMIHEVFHILSRYHKDLREDLYALIGFKAHNQTPKFSEAMKAQWLTNPDGVTKDYYIELSDGDMKAKALPLIMSNKKKFVASSPAFFSYLQFELFELEKDGNVAHTADMGTTLTDGMMPSFFDQIKDNTQYIIHPDEISADNFIYAITIPDVDKRSDFSSDGAKLIRDMQAILRNY